MAGGDAIARCLIGDHASTGSPEPPARPRFPGRLCECGSALCARPPARRRGCWGIKCVTHESDFGAEHRRGDKVSK